jgi:hypothetical protein
MTLRGWLYRSARVLGDVEAISSGKPATVARRAKNRLLWRLLGRAGLWQRLWK